MVVTRRLASNPNQPTLIYQTYDPQLQTSLILENQQQPTHQVLHQRNNTLVILHHFYTVEPTTKHQGV